MGRKVILLELPADVLFCILAALDVYAIISLGQTCKRLYSLAFSEFKSIWLDLLADLKCRGFIDEATTPDLVMLSAKELIDCVKRLAIGPSTWTPTPDGTFVPRVRMQRVVQLRATDEDFAYWSTARLLPGGRYIMAIVGGRLAAWDIILDQRVPWNLDVPADAAGMIWDVKRSGDDEHTFIVAESTWESNHLFMLYILEINLCSGTQTRYISIEFGADELSLQCDFCVLKDGGGVILLHWCSHTAVRLQCGATPGAGNNRFHLALIPGYAVILLTAVDRPDNIFILHESTLREHLAPFSDILQVECLNMEELLHSAQLIYEFEGSALPPDTHYQYASSNHTLTVCPSPMAPDEYRVWVSIRKRFAQWISGTAITRIYSLRLRVPRSKMPDDALQLRVRSSTPLASKGGWQEAAGLTFSGHDLDAVGEVGLPQVPGRPPLTHVSSHAGAWSCTFQRQDQRHHKTRPPLSAASRRLTTLPAFDTAYTDLCA
ncbi:hypothetical protein C8R45DRAFT_1089038 [Mycena sanguinolenta]|nr:hypothetical protein C8R45DRAFT_1089038 [Mycena sanguinolenta]